MNMKVTKYPNDWYNISMSLTSHQMQEKINTDTGIK